MSIVSQVSFFHLTPIFLLRRLRLFRGNSHSSAGAVTPTASQTDNPIQLRPSTDESQSQLLPAFSPYSQDSEPDVTAYAEAVVQKVEQTQEVVPTKVHQSADESSDEIQGLQNPTEVASNLEIRRSSTPVLAGTEILKLTCLPRISFSTMERMVIHAIKWNPTTAPSRTAHFRCRDRAQTPGPKSHRDSSSSESDRDAHPETRTEGFGDVDGSSFYGESDSATEMV